MSDVEEKKALADDLLKLLEANKFNELIEKWANNDITLDYSEEVDYDIASSVTLAYFKLNDLDKAYIYAKYQINYILNKKSEWIQDRLGTYLNILCAYFNAKHDKLKYTRVLMSFNDYKLKRLDEYNHIGDLDKEIRQLERGKIFSRVYWVGALILLPLVGYRIYASSNGIILPEGFSWAIDLVFYPYIAYLIIPPFRRWLIKGWVKQYVKIT